MTKPTPIQGKDGKFKGSIGTGKTEIPAPQDPNITFERQTLSDALDRMGTREKGVVTLEELQAAYQAEIVGRAKLRGEEDVKLVRETVQKATESYWADFVPAVGDSLPATYEAHQRLAVGTVIRIEKSTEAGGYWNGALYVKTTDSTWANLPGRQTFRVTELQAFNAVMEQQNNVSPYPGAAGGEWLIVALIPDTPAGETTS